MTISAKKLAEKLNISAATVSMVFHNKPGISEKTRLMVLHAAEEYGYQPKKTTKPLTAVHHIFYVILKKHGNVVSDTPFFTQVMEGIYLQCDKRNCSVYMKYLYTGEKLQSQLEELMSTECDGILLLGTEMNGDDYRAISNLTIPLVVLDSYFEEVNHDAVLINNVQGAYLATCYLIQHGHQKIGYLKSSVSINNFEERADGYYKALRHHDISTSHPYVCKVAPTAELAYDDIMDYLSKKPELPTAYFADNDIIAAAALRALKDHGVKVPQDVSMIGFDDMPICRLTDPQLTTMCVPKERLGGLAVDRLLELMQNESQARTKTEVGTTLIERSSVASLTKQDF